MTDTTSTVITEILGGDALTLAAAARFLPPHRGRATAPSTLWRWHRQGVRAGPGRVHLELARVGAKWCTSKAALARFLAALTPSLSAAKPNTPCPSQRRRDRERAARDLERAGIRRPKPA